MKKSPVFIAIKLLFFINHLLIVANNAQTVGKVPIFSVCNPVSYGSECGANAVCATPLPGACQRGVCMCQSPDYVPLYHNTANCALLLKPGDPCSAIQDAALIPDYTQCLNGILVCVMDFVASNRSCVSPYFKGLPGEVCDETWRCNEALLLHCAQSPTTNQRRCQCVNDLIFKDGRCQPALFGDSCTTDDQCNAVYVDSLDPLRSICYNGICVCSPEYIRASAIVQTPPSSTVTQKANAIGSYCFSSLLMPRMTAQPGQYCSALLPYETFNPTKTYCAPDLVCVHCAEYTPLTMGVCQRVPSNMLTFPPTFRPPTSTARPTTARTTPRAVTTPRLATGGTTARAGSAATTRPTAGGTTPINRQGTTAPFARPPSTTNEAKRQNLLEKNTLVVALALPLLFQVL